MDLTANGGDSGNVLSNLLPQSRQKNDPEENFWQIASLPDQIGINYGNDRNNTERYTTLRLKVGGPEAARAKASGSHWHVSRASA